MFLGLGSGEALNEQPATGDWPAWSERWEGLIEAIGIIRALWSGQPVNHRGKYYTVDGRLYDPPPRPIPILTAANGKKSMRLSGMYAMGWSRIRSPGSISERSGRPAREMPARTSPSCRF